MVAAKANYLVVCCVEVSVRIVKLCYALKSVAASRRVAVAHKDDCSRLGLYSCIIIYNAIADKKNAKVVTKRTILLP
jgi:hypothetical protein